MLYFGLFAKPDRRSRRDVPLSGILMLAALSELEIGLAQLESALPDLRRKSRPSVNSNPIGVSCRCLLHLRHRADAQGGLDIRA